MTENTKLAEEYANRVWNEKDVGAFDAYVDENVIIHSLLGDYQGIASMKKMVITWLTAFPDMRVDNIATIAENDRVALQWTVTATHNGEFKGIKPTHKAVSYSGVTIYKFTGRKITEYWAYIDMQHLLSQIS